MRVSIICAVALAAVPVFASAAGPERGPQSGGLMRDVATAPMGAAPRIPASGRHGEDELGAQAHRLSLGGDPRDGNAPDLQGLTPTSRSS